MEDDNKQSVEKYKPGDLTKVDDGQSRPREDRFLDLPPVPEHSHQYEGRIREVLKRGRIRSHRRTTEELTGLAEQENELYDELIPLGEKRYELSRIKDRAVVDDLKVRRDAAKVQSAIVKKQGQIRSRALLGELELGRDAAKVELETVELDKQRVQNALEIQRLHNQLYDSCSDGAASRIQQKVEQICAKVSTIARLQEACREMKERSPADLHPLIDRLFRKEIDQRKEGR